jgi:oxygen-independent coproporphyrinogen-3 oxidase
VLTAQERRAERILLTARLSSGCPASELSAAGREAASAAAGDGLADPAALSAGRVVLTPTGRLLADAVIRGLTDE